MDEVINNEYEILTSEGFKDFSGVKKLKTKIFLEIYFEDGSHIICTSTHLFQKNNDFVKANTLQKGDVLSDKKITSIIEKLEDIDVYDALNVADTNHYITEKVTSHNCAFIEGYEEFFRSVYPTISSGKTTKMLMTSTPNGLNHFWKIWEGAINEKNGYEYVEVKWDRVPGRDADWKNETLQAINFDYESFEQEYNCSFMGSTSTLLKSQTLKNLTFDYPMVETEGISQYEKPQPNHQYVATVDVSQGKGLDYSTISIFDISTLPYKQVCTFRDNMISAMDFSPLIFRLCTFYNNAQLLIEVNDTGVMVAETLLMDLGYEELLFTENSGRHGKRISGGFSANKVDKGLRTSKTTKAKGCSILKMLIEQEQLIIRDYHTISELSRFVKRGASYQAEVGYHDDMVMTLVNFAWLTEQQYFKDLTDIDTAQALREKTDQQWEDELLPLGFNNAGGDVHSLMHPNEEIVEWNK